MSPKATDVVAAAVPIAVGDPNPTHAPLDSGRLRKRFVELPFAPATRSTRPSPLTSPVANELTFGVARVWLGVSSNPSHGSCAAGAAMLSASELEIASAICAP